MDWQARGVIDALAYGVDLRRPASAADVERVVAGVLAQRTYPEPVARYAAAARQLLRDGGPIARENEDDQHLRDFLARVLDALEERRPWPEKAYRQVRAQGRVDLLTAAVRARIPQRRRIVEAHLGLMFERPGPGMAAAVLELDGGTRVALTASTEPGTATVEVRALAGDPAEVALLVRRSTGLPVEPAD